ncbi:MAG: hypothetical protein LBJ46_11635 [Planctomycetota bacterium]|jgi:hypothetical protein|nr:hypothetical protein [Planctomycetota bacterium]
MIITRRWGRYGFERGIVENNTQADFESGSQLDIQITLLAVPGMPPGTVFVGVPSPHGGGQFAMVKLLLMAIPEVGVIGQRRHEQETWQDDNHGKLRERDPGLPEHGG